VAGGGMTGGMGMPGGTGGTPEMMPPPKGQLTLRVSDNKRYLVDGKGAPILLWGEGSWTLNSQMHKAEQDRYLDDRASRGINAFGLQLISRYQDNSPADAEGVAPFTTPGDFATFNPEYFAKAADLVKRAAQRGMIVFIAPCWAGYDQGQGWYDVMVANGPAKSRAYGAAVAGVFKDLDNVIWVMGGDKPGNNFSTTEIEAMTAGVRSVDKNHLVTAHWNFKPSDAHPGAWVDIASCYDWNNGVSYTQVEQEYAENDAPVILLEALYELNNQFGYTEQILRTQSIMALLSGAKGSFFGHEGIWHLGASKNLPSQSRGFPLDYNSVGMRHQQNILKLFAPRAWHELVPDTGNALVTAGRGQHGNVNYVGAARTPDGKLAIAYVPTATTITVNVGSLTVPLTARWYDPTNGNFQPIKTYSAAENAQLTPPGKNSAGGSDWLLLLEP
jgi:hypothetical protein